jgi:hypothetical protein
MANEQLKRIVESMLDDAAKRLMVVDEIRGVAITLIHEDKALPLGTLILRDHAQQRDVVVGLRKLGDTQEILTRLLLDSLDRRTSDARKGDAGVGVEENVGDVPDGSRPPDQPETAGPPQAAEEEEGESG